MAGTTAFADGVWLKREDAHELGAFKWRGALAVLERMRPKTVVTASTGNHAAERGAFFFEDGAEGRAPPARSTPTAARPSRTGSPSVAIPLLLVTGRNIDDDLYHRILTPRP